MPDATPSAHPNPIVGDAHRHGRVQEGVAIVLALIVLVATFVVAATSVAAGTVPAASRTEAADEREQSMSITVVAEGASFTDRICSFGPHDLTPLTG
jgi:uncharacterized cupredoxin-like copper-binding protein